MRSPEDFFKPLCVGAPDPVREIPFPPSRMIHFFDVSNEKMVAKLPDIAREGRHRARQPRGRRPRRPQGGRARRAWSRSARRSTSATTQLWTRVNALESPWVLDDLTHARHRDRRQARRHHGPQGRGPVGHPLRRPPARPARGQRRPEQADPRPRASSRRPRASPTSTRSPRPRPRMQGMSFGPADLAASRRMKTTRVGGGHPGYRRRSPTRTRENPDAPRPTRPAGPLALLDRAHGRRLHDERDPAVLRAVRRHQGRRRLRGAVPRRLPARLRRRVVAAPRADRHRQEGLLPRPGRGQVRQEGHRGDPRRPRRPHDRRQDAGRRDLEAVPGHGRPRRRCSPRRTRSCARPTGSEARGALRRRRGGPSPSATSAPVRRFSGDGGAVVALHAVLVSGDIVAVD